MRKFSLLLVLGTLALVALYGTVVLYATWPVSTFSVEKAGAFGDSFGLLTSLFSGLAFSGIIITILLQREELRQQREELRLQREEIARNREELARTAAAQERSEEWFAYQARMMSLSALASVIEIKMRIGEGHDRVLVNSIYKELSGALKEQKLAVGDKYIK